MQLIELAKQKLGSYRAVAKYLGVHETFISMVRRGTRQLPALMAGRLAELLELPPIDVVLQSLEESALKKDEAATWKKWRKQLANQVAAVCVVAGLSGIGTLAPSSASESYIDIREGNNNSESLYSMRPRNGRRRGERLALLEWIRAKASAITAAVIAHQLMYRSLRAASTAV